MFGFKIITQWEQGVVFRFGRALPGTRKPGLTWVNPFTDRLRKVNMQIVVVAVPAQEAITIDNVTVRVDAVVYYRVVDPFKAIVNVQNYHHAVSQVAQTSLRSVIGQNDLDQLLSGREKINAHLKDVIDAPTEGPWGILVERVELKDISLPESMKRSMSRQAEAERERRARVIAADGEFQASTRLAEAATVMAADPAALQLRLLQTVVEVAAEKNSTLVMPFPVELLRFFDNATQAPGRVRSAATDAGPADGSPQATDVPALTEAIPPVGVSLAEQLNGVPKVPTGQPRLRLRQRTAERAAVAHLRVSHGACRLRDQCRMTADQLVVRHVVVSGHRTDDDRVAVVADAAQLGDAADVDQGGREGHPQPQDRQQRLPAGQHLAAAV